MAKHSLMQHQIDGVKFLDSMDGIGALLFDPGVGKTYTTLAYIDLLAQRQREVRVLVVAPLTAADTWVLQPPSIMDSTVKARMLQGSTAQILKKIEKAADWTQVPDSKIKVDHPGSLASQVSGNRVTILSMSAGAVSTFCSNRAKTVQMLRAIKRYKPDLIVVDESHIIKSATANISKAMYQIGQTTDRRIILTGTVAPHSPLDVYGQWRFLAPWTFSESHGDPATKAPLKMTPAQKKQIRPWSWGKFRDRYAMMGGFQGKVVVGISDVTESELNDRVAERSMVVRKEDALDLPPTSDVDVHVTLSPKEAKAYAEMRDQLAIELESGELLAAANPMVKYMKLRQVTAGFAKDTETGETHVIGSSKRAAIKEVVTTQLAGEKRLVIFAYFRSECEMLANSLKAKGVTVECITGSTPARERLAIRQRFADLAGNPQRTILVAQARTMSLSVNELVVAQHAIFGSMSERREDWVQSRGRLDRNGQTLPVTFWNVFVPNSVDSIMLSTHKHKGDLEKALLDHIKGAPRGGVPTR